MEGLWILLGAALSTASGIVFWLLHSRTARETQERQQRHDLQMQQQQVVAERQNAQDEAIRAMKRARLQPVFEALAQLDDGFAHFRWQKMADSLEETGEIGEAARKRFPEGVSTEVIRDVVSGLRKEFPAPTAAGVLRAITTLHRVADSSLQEDAVAVLLPLLMGDSAEDERQSAASRLPSLYARLETYAARTDDPPEAEP